MNRKIMISILINSPEPKAHRWAYSIGKHPWSVRPPVVQPAVSIFKRLLLWSREADSFHISHIASIVGGNEYLCFLFKLDKNSGCYGNLYFLLTYNGKNGKWQFLVSHRRYLDFFLQKCFLSSPLRFIWILSKWPNSNGCHGNIKGNFRNIIKKSSPQKP